MDNDSIRVWDRLKGMAFVPLLAPGRALTLLPRRLGTPKAIHRGGTTAVATVLVQLGFEVGNPGLEVSVLSTEFCDETFEILEGCKKNRNIRNGILRERTVLNTRFGIRVLSSHCTLFGCHYKKIFWLG